MTGLLRPDGSLVWWDALDQSAPEWPAFGDFDGDGRMEAIGIGYDDGVRCYDLASGKVKWRLPAPVPANVAGCASGDLDGDGRDEALFMIGQELVCLGSSNGTGWLKWKFHLPVVCGPPALAVLEPGGTLSVLLAGSDGYVYCVR
jgi:outer membrane protein assembly factor BamB